jgi:hypothetical protein
MIGAMPSPSAPVPPNSAATARRRLLLVPTESRHRADTTLRRYRLARVQLAGRQAAARPADRSAPGRRSCD